MPMDIVNDITITEAESVIVESNNLNFPVFLYLSQERQDNIRKLDFLEKKIALSNALLTIFHDQENQMQICKLNKKKEGFEKEKINLTISIKKLKYIISSVKDFILFFIFIKRFHTLAIVKKNFELKGKKISVKLINKLKSEEENLYNQFINGDCFSKVLLALSFETYQCYFKEYAKSFFDNLQHSSIPYVNSLLILQAVLYECNFFNVNLDLSSLKLFLSQKIPANVHLPNTNYELIALRCFFYYELMFYFLNLKLVKTNLEYLKKSVKLEFNIINYEASIKKSFVGLKYLQDILEKIEKKYNDFLRIKSCEDQDADVNKSLVFYNTIEKEIQNVNKKAINLINNKDINLTELRQILAIIVNEAHLPKFLELFNAKVGNDFPLNNMRRSEFIETNQEALNHLFHAISRDEFYTPLNARSNLFINEVTKTCSKDDTSVLDNIELEGLIDFSFYYIFILLYTDFNANLEAFNNKLLYTELDTLSVFTNIKLKAIEFVEKRKNEEIDKFFERRFKNKIKYNLHKENILEQIKLNSEIIQDTSRILSDTKALESSLIPKLESSSRVPMPHKNSLLDLLRNLEKKQKICELEYQKIEKHKFVNNPKSAKTNKTNQVHIKKVSEIEYDTAIGFLYDSLSCLSENLSESLKYIKEYTQDKNQFRQKISSAFGQIASSVQKLLTGLSNWKNPNETSELTSLCLPKLLGAVEELIIKNTLIVRKDHKKKLTQLQELLDKSCLSIEFLLGEVNSMIIAYHNYNHEAKKALDILSTFFIKNNPTSHFFDKLPTKKIKRQIKGKLSNDYRNLKEQSNWLEKIIRLIKCDTDDRVIKLYGIIVEADDYQKACELLKEKINFIEKLPDKKFNNLKSNFSAFKEDSSSNNDVKNSLPHSNQLIEVVNDITAGNLSGVLLDKSPSIFSSQRAGNEHEQLGLNQDLISFQEQKSIEKKYKEESLSIAIPENLVIDSDQAKQTLFEDYENWNIDFEKWKNEKNTKIYELFHIIETCSKSVLGNTSKAFLACLASYREEFSVKNDELRIKESEVTLYFKRSNQAIMISYLSQYQKWFDEILQRILDCKTLILQNEQNALIQESARLPSPFADNRAEFNSLLTFYLGASDKYNKFRDNLINEENKLNNLNRNFIKQVLRLGSSDRMDNEGNILSDFSKQLDRVNQLKLAIEHEFETKQKIKEKLSLLASPEIVKFYLSRIDPRDAGNLKNTENYWPLIHTTTTSCAGPTSPQECNICTTPAAFYYLPPSMPVIYPIDNVQPQNQIFYPV